MPDLLTATQEENANRPDIKATGREILVMSDQITSGFRRAIREQRAAELIDVVLMFGFQFLRN
jgi:hypothetical protein